MVVQQAWSAQDVRGLAPERAHRAAATGTKRPMETNLACLAKATAVQAGIAVVVVVAVRVRAQTVELALPTNIVQAAVVSLLVHALGAEHVLRAKSDSTVVKTVTRPTQASAPLAAQIGTS